MSPYIKANYEVEDFIRDSNYEVDKVPDTCPLCHRGIEPIKRFGWEEDRNLSAIFQCPKKECRSLFIAHYLQPYSGLTGPGDLVYSFKFCEPWKVKKKVFHGGILNISSKFFVIYNQAKEAEERGLKEICGAGYRRALEFLIKDYLIKEKIETSKIIKETRLGTCIDKYVASERIKDCARRAAWLGNDETHYIRKWEDKDLEDLKDLIELTVNWIRDEYLTRRIKKEMPEKKAKA